MKKLGIITLVLVVFLSLAVQNSFAKGGDSSGSGKDAIEANPQNDLGKLLPLNNFFQTLRSATSSGTEKPKFTDSLSEFKFLKNQEIKEKEKQVAQDRRACLKQVTDLMKQKNQEREAKRKEIVSSCKVALPDPKPSTPEEWKSYYDSAKAAALDCRSKLKEFNTTDRKSFQQDLTSQVKEIRTSCITSERKVLGLSTDVTY